MRDVTYPAHASSDILPGRTKELASALAQFPRLRLGHFPTPLEPMDRLRAVIDCKPRLWIKRDDCTGLSLGGNTTRKLEFLMADALDHGATVILTHGTPQCNHARQTAAAAARLGLPCHVLLESRAGYADPAYVLPGNKLLDQLHGAIVTSHPQGADMTAEIRAAAARLRAAGQTPYVIPDGGSNAIGALGYVNCARELVDQASAIGLRVDAVIQATGSAGTQAGLVAGLAALQSDIHLLGIGVNAPQDQQEQKVFDLAQATADLLGLGPKIDRARVHANCDFIGAGFGLTSDGMAKAVKLVAGTEGLLVDPVYAGKGFDGMITLLGTGVFDHMDNIVFLHTGGIGALFGYQETGDMPPHP